MNATDGESWEESPRGYAVELYLDRQAAAVIRRIRRVLCEHGIGGRLEIPSERPHVSLAVFPSSVDCRVLVPLVRAYAMILPVATVELSAIGTFPTEGNVLFLVPVPSVQLLRTHEELHRRLAAKGLVPSAYYLPGTWVPHCSLGLDIPPAQLASAVELCKGMFSPVQGQLEELGIIADWRGVTSLGAWPLAATVAKGGEEVNAGNRRR